MGHVNDSRSVFNQATMKKATSPLRVPETMAVLETESKDS